MLTVTHECKLRPNKRQVEIFETWLNVCRQVYNYALRERKNWVNSRKSPVNACSIVSEYIISPDTPRPTYASQCKSLAEAKKSYPELKVPHSQVLQQTLKVLESAFVAMWERGYGFPRFKKRMRSFSDGELVNRPRFFNALHRELKLLQRRLKHKRKGSNSWLKLQGKIARIYQRISDTRKDWHYKLAHQLCDQAGMIFVEDLNFKAWAKGLMSSINISRELPKTNILTLCRFTKVSTISWLITRMKLISGKL
jgi:transposase